MTSDLPRMRIRRGRVMHRVELTMNSTWYQSLCTAPRSTLRRAYGPCEDWSDDPYSYPDCENCPGREA